MNNPKYINLPIGSDFLAIADALIEARDYKGLDSFQNALTGLALSNIAGEDVSFIEINEYIGEARELLRTGKTPGDAKRSSLRRLLSQDSKF